MSNLYVEKLRHDSKPPFKATDHAACHDVFANLSGPSTVKVFDVENRRHEQNVFDQPVKLNPGDRALIPTGLKVCCDIGYCVKVYARSGLSVKNGLTIANCVGVIDADYRQELFVAVINQTVKPQIIDHNDRIAQIMIEKLDDTVIIDGNLPPIDSNRNGGFGHTGTK